MPDTAQDIIDDAFREIGVYGPGSTPSTVNRNYALRVLNREVNAWAALKRYVYSVTFTAYTLTPNHQPHLIGPGLASPDFAAAQRPVKIEGADLILNNVTPNVDIPLNIRDDQWWLNQRVKAIATTTPTDLYYSPDWPNGSLWLWPIPTFAYGLRLEAWTLVSEFASLSDLFSLPPGYKKALTLTLANLLCRAFGRPTMADLVADAAKARADLQTANISSPRIASADYGATGSRKGRPTFNYYTGQ